MAKKIKKFEKKSGAPAGVDSIQETMEVKFELKQIIDTNEDFFIVEGYASAFGLIDTYDDRIEAGAYLDTIKSHPAGFPALTMHRSFDMPVGMFFDLKEDNKGLFVIARLPKADHLVEGRLVPQIKTGSINALSIGFFAREFRFERIDDREIRILTKIELREISFITAGMQADSGALLTDIKKEKDRSDKQNMFNAMVDVYRKGASPKVKIEVKEFYHEDGKSDPFAESSVISTDELKNLSKSNLVYAIKELTLSTNASNYLAGLALTPVSQKDNPKGDGDDPTKTDPVEPSTEEKAEEEKRAVVSGGMGDIIETLKKQQETSNG